jgi:hypothetical protein
MRDEYEITDSIQILIDDGFKVKSLCVVQEDINLTFPSDLLSVNLAVLRNRGQSVCIGRNVRGPAGWRARVTNSVIGDDAEIEPPISIRESLVFPGARVRSGEDIHRSIVTDAQVISCPSTATLRSIPLRSTSLRPSFDPEVHPPAAGKGPNGQDRTGGPMLTSASLRSSPGEEALSSQQSASTLRSSASLRRTRRKG